MILLPSAFEMPDSISWPEFKWMAIWDLIVAAFRSQDRFPLWRSEKSILRRKKSFSFATLLAVTRVKAQW